jgi:hypothetical protein
MKEMNKQELLDLLYEHRVKIFLFGLMLIILTFAVMVHDAREITAANMDSNPESRCDNLGYYNDFNVKLANEWFCDYNETGWHFNRTRYDYFDSLVKS